MEYYKRFLKDIETKTILGKSTTSEHDLTHIANTLFGKSFLGVFTADEINTRALTTKRPYAIVNLSKRASGGSHWICLVAYEQSILAYDSFGVQSHKLLGLNDSKRSILDTDLSDREQTLKQKNCGQRCLSALCVYHWVGYDAFMEL